MSGYPPDQYPPNQSPQNPQNQPSPNQYPQQQYPQQQYPQQPYPPQQQEPGSYAPNQYPQQQYPSNQYPPNQYPPNPYQQNPYYQPNPYQQNQMGASPYVPCPRCRMPSPQLVKFTWWGGLLGPKMLSHVKCQQCKLAYNGKTGQSNTTGIIIYSIIVGVIFFALFAFIAIASR